VSRRCSSVISSSRRIPWRMRFVCTEVRPHVGQIRLRKGQPDHVIQRHADRPLPPDELAQDIGHTPARGAPSERDNMRSRNMAFSCIALHHRAAPIRGWLAMISITASRPIAAIRVGPYIRQRQGAGEQISTLGPICALHLRRNASGRNQTDEPPVIALTSRLLRRGACPRAAHGADPGAPRNDSQFRRHCERSEAISVEDDWH
jgi:hypothetical protein